MGKKNYFIVVSLVFLLAFVLHLIRAVRGWNLTIENASIPVWISWIAVVISGVLCWQGFKFFKEEKK